VQVGGEFQLEMFEPTWEEGSRTYGSPLQVKANGGVLLIDDLGRQRVPPKQILDRLLVPLEQEIDYMNLASTGRKVEVPFWCQLALSTNLKPAELLDEAYLRRLSYKVLMPDPTWDMWCRIFERERERLTIPPNPAALDWIRTMYGGRPLRGNHPRSTSQYADWDWSGASSGKTWPASVHTIRTRAIARLQWRPISIPATLPSRTLESMGPW
jgi:hypothetical protein